MWKSLAAGTLPPLVTLTLHLDVPLDLSADYPAVVTVNGKQAVQVIKTEPAAITLRNLTKRNVPYWLVVVPRVMVTTNWVQVINNIRQKLLKKE